MMKHVPYRSMLMGAAVAAVLAVPATSHADQQVAQTLDLPASLRATVTAMDCHNAPGPQVTLDGSIVLGGVGFDLIFRNNINKDVHVATEEVRADLTVVNAGDEIVIPKQPVLGGTGGNPFIWIQLIDNRGRAVTDEVYLGRCVQGLFQPNAAWSNAAFAVANVAVMDCTNNPGPYINVGGTIAMTAGLQARFIFRNNDNPVGGPHSAMAVRDVALIATGMSRSIPKQPVYGGVGGNPWISAQFEDEAGNGIGNETLLGRCVQLAPGN
jgi:hypothetical protein